MPEPANPAVHKLVSPTVTRLSQRLKSAGQTVAVAESSTAGLISAKLLAVPGASAFYLGGSVVYTLISRKELLRIRKQDVAGLEPLTEPMVQAFAERARAQLDATWGIAELGVAGPTGAPYGHPAGTCVIAVAGPVTLTHTVITQDTNREANMWHFAEQAMVVFDQALERSIQ
ncbi:MAG: CinA family protein [Pseudomonadaceae bacterium]|nr:CinA family protein [Pseudomonadaceae bacterium]